MVPILEKYGYGYMVKQSKEKFGINYIKKSKDDLF
jgi:hypothetical protein